MKKFIVPIILLLPIIVFLIVLILLSIVLLQPTFIFIYLIKRRKDLHELQENNQYQIYLKKRSSLGSVRVRK